MFNFGADGTTHIATINIPVALHDSNQCFFGNEYKKLDAIFERTGFRVSLDSVFNMKNRDSMVKSTPGEVLGLGTIRARENISIRRLS